MMKTRTNLRRASVLAACTIASGAARTAHADPPVPRDAQTSATSASPASIPSAQTERASAEAAASSQQPVPSVHASTPAEIRYRRVSVDIASSRPDAVVERRQNVKEDSGAFLFFPWRDTSSTWEQVCVSPCLAADLDRYSTYRVAAANGITSSHPFTLPQTGDAVHLRLDAGNRTANHIGVAMGAAGLAAVIVGGSLLLAASDARTHTDDVHERTGGFIAGGVGIAFLAVGIPLAILTRTYVYADDKPVRDAKVGPRFSGNGFVF